ncbi:hypothetical protein SAY86_025205 [Trapa natans]|uniref:Uncharacterized protein n=1 Tax=Trapa natans TaxID=22666 RepID=A0AAN7MQM5_TRANT|nr:hypothetical protein SAY86_025205 [Trapa natans]
MAASTVSMTNPSPPHPTFIQSTPQVLISSGSCSSGGGGSKWKNLRLQRKCSFTKKCGRLANEQRARFYIMRRCIIMLICWRDS